MTRQSEFISSFLWLSVLAAVILVLIIPVLTYPLTITDIYVIIITIFVLIISLCLANDADYVEQARKKAVTPSYIDNK